MNLSLIEWIALGFMAYWLSCVLVTPKKKGQRNVR